MAQDRNFRGYRGYRHYIWFAGSAGLYVLVLSAVLDDLIFTQLLITLGALALLILTATIVHTAIWSVFGTGSLIKRTLLSLAMASIVLLGSIIGLFILSSDSGESGFLSGQIATLLLFPVVVAAQIPFWICRGLFGLQIVYRDDAPSRMSIQQLMLITLFFGLSFALPAVANQLLVSDATDLVVGESVYVANDDEMVTITEENKEQIQGRIALGTDEDFNFTLLVYAGVFTGASLLSLPIIWFVFCVSRKNIAVCLSLYGLLGLGVLVVWQFFTDPSSIVGSDLLYLCFFLLMAIGMIAAPLLISRSKGFRMVTGRAKSVVKDSSVVVDPLA